jgi:hypothetical protein
MLVAERSCADVNVVYLHAEYVFNLDHFFASKSFAVHEEFSNAYPDSKVLNNTIHRLVTEFRYTGSVCL